MQYVLNALFHSTCSCFFPLIFMKETVLKFFLLCILLALGATVMLTWHKVSGYLPFLPFLWNLLESLRMTCFLKAWYIPLRISCLFCFKRFHGTLSGTENIWPLFTVDCLFCFIFLVIAAFPTIFPSPPPKSLGLDAALTVGISVRIGF